MASKNEIRTSWKARTSGCLGGWLIRLLGMTLRCEIVGEVGKLNQRKEPIIHVLWHNQIIVSPYLWRKMYGKREVVVLTSASMDGVVLASAVKVFKVGAVHGSSSRRGAPAIVALRRAAKEGKDLVFTPDGPRGPRYQLQPGVVKIAQTTGLLVVPMHIEYLSCWTLKTWDRFQIPKPFSKVRLTLREPITIPRKLDDEGFEKERLRLENSLLEGITDHVDNHGDDH
ncbi:MAG: lysophospholipid acyltransferase family protein [Akkermansiaceae bacterium]|nr:lysophospholipid acyltransferase family protein [Akkermansiaceae bacterium]